MPTLYAQKAWKITMYFRDHDPPHFHVVTKDRQEAQIRIADFAVMSGEVPRQTLRAALQWAGANKLLLKVKWRELHP